jgi:hypothetical protein
MRSVFARFRTADIHPAGAFEAVDLDRCRYWSAA